MIKAGDKIQYDQNDQMLQGTVKTGPYPKEFLVKYPDDSPTTFVEDAYDIEVDAEGTVLEGVRRRYLKKVK